MRWPVLTCLFLISFCASGICATTSRQQPIVITVWTYIIDIYDIDLRNQELVVEFYLTLSYRKEDIKIKNLLDTIEIFNAKKYNYLSKRKEIENGFVTEYARCQATITCNWQMTSFPFDKHIVTIILEDSQHTSSDLIFKMDLNSGIDNGISVPHWKLIDYSQHIGSKKWIWGEPDEFSRYIFSFNINRSDSFLLSLRLFLPVLFALILAGFAFWLRKFMYRPANITLIAASLATVIGNYSATQKNLPFACEYNLSDIIHQACLAISIFVLIVMIISWKR
jgi:hypothetical protein